MEAWNDIINTALLGTEKKPLVPQAGPTTVHDAAAAALRQAMAQINTQAGLDKEERFLQIAALTFNVRQSGTSPLHQPALKATQAAAESQPYCSQRAAQVLKDILEQDTQPLIALWLERCAAANQIVLPELLPTLLDHAKQHKHLRQAITTVCGRRGQWLSRLNPAWEFSSATDEEQLWQTGTLDQRKAALHQMRQQDPAKAREWLEQAWPQENANTRTELLKQLDGTTQPEDEPFLLNALNEKSQKVKEAAISLLQQLPGSTLVKKYMETAAPLITVKKEKALLGLTTKTTLSVQPAPIPEKTAELPGVSYLSGNKTFTDGEFVLHQLIQLIPPAFWEGHLALPPDEILKLFSGKNEKYLVSFATASIQFRDTKWAAAYIQYTDEWLPGIVSLLPESMREGYCRRNISLYFNQEIVHGRHWQPEWSIDLTKTIVDHLVKNPYSYNISFYKANIVRMPMATPGIMDQAAPSEPRQRDQWLGTVGVVRKLLNLKQEIQNVFTV